MPETETGSGTEVGSGSGAFPYSRRRDPVRFAVLAALTLTARALLSLLLAAVLVAVAAAAAFVTAAPAWFSLLVEPLSLFLLPGFGFSVLLTKDHEFTRNAVLITCFGFYALCWFVLFTLRARRPARCASR